MKILALDTSGTNCSVSIIDEDKVIADFNLNTGLTHSQTLMPLIDSMCKFSEIDLKDIDVFACSIGPGSFTGLRIGIATIKGFALSLNKKVIAVPTLVGLAYNITNFDGIICSVLDARNDNVYAALFKYENKPKMIENYITDSVDTLIENLKVILIQEFNFTEYNSAKSFSVDYYGQFFMKNDLYFWIGIYLHDNNLYIGFNDSDYWVPETIRNNIKTLIKTNKKTDYYSTTEDQDGNYGKFWFCMENMKCLCSEDSNLEVQKKSLKDFIKAVFRDIGVEKYLS